MVSAFDMLLLCCFQFDMVGFDVLQIITLCTQIFNRSPLGLCKNAKSISVKLSGNMGDKPRRKRLNLDTDVNKGRDME